MRFQLCPFKHPAKKISYKKTHDASFVTNKEIGAVRREMAFAVLEQLERVRFGSVKSVLEPEPQFLSLKLILEDACYSKIKHQVSHLHLFIIEK